MRSCLERLLMLFTPLFAVAATRKKAIAKKPKTARTRAATTPARRTRTPASKGKPSRPARRTNARGKEQPGAKAAAPKAPPGPPTPKPPAPIGRALLLMPENGKYADSVHPKFRWLSVGGATRYEVVWSEDPGFAGARSVISIATEAAVPPDRPLRVGATYFWRVRGGNEGGWGPWSPTSSFQVLEAPPAA